MSLNSKLMSDQLYNSAEENASLPAVIPSSALVLRRTQTALELLRDVVLESSTTYWYKQGKLHNDNYNWEAAIYSLSKCMNDRQSYFFLKAHVQLLFALIQHNSINLAAKLLSKEYKLYSFVGGIKFSSISNELTSLQWKAIGVSLLSYSSLSSKSLDSLWALAAFYAAQSEHSNLRKILDTIFLEHKTSFEHSAEWFEYSGDCWRWHSDGKQMSKALADYSRAVELDSTKSWLLRSIGFIKLELCDYDGALSFFHSALLAGVKVFSSLEHSIKLAKLRRDYESARVYISLFEQLKLKHQ